MALTRKFLSALGIEADKIDEIITAHAESIDGIKAERDSYKANNEAYEELKKKFEVAEKSLAEFQKDDYKSKYESIKSEFDAYKKDVADKSLKQSKETAFKELLKETGISEKRFDSIIKVTDMSAFDFAEGKFTNHDKVIEAIKSEWSDFIPNYSDKGADIPNPPANNGGNVFESMTLTEKMAFANEHPTNADVQKWLSN